VKRAGAWLGACALACACACSKPDPEKTVVVESQFAQAPVQPRAAPTAAPSAEEPSSPRLSDLEDAAAPAEQPAAPAPAPTATAKPEDPDQPVLQSARVAASQCLTSAPVTASSRSAHLTVTVIPTGSVTRAEVTSSDTTEPDVLACIKSVGQGLRFAAADGKTPGVTAAAGSLRTYAIDVMVTSGGR
jgi:hypothetical protein